MAIKQKIMFCSVQDVNDKIGKTGGATKPTYMIVSGGTIEPAACERWIERRSGIINEEHSMNFNPTTVTNE